MYPIVGSAHGSAWNGIRLPLSRPGVALDQPQEHTGQLHAVVYCPQIHLVEVPLRGVYGSGTTRQS